MLQRTFMVKACWDEDAKVFYAESDIIGLGIEADTIEEFEELLFDVAVELIIANHVTAQDIAERPMTELVPAILWQRPDAQMACVE